MSSEEGHMHAKQLVIGTLAGAVTVLAIGYLIFTAALGNFYACAMNGGSATGVAREPPLCIFGRRLYSRPCRQTLMSVFKRLEQIVRMSALVSFLLLPCSSVAHAQSDFHNVYVTGRIGGDFEGTDPGSGTSIAVGGSFGFSFTERWSVDIEAWVPKYIADVACPPGDALAHCGPGKFRDVLVGVSAVRRFGGQGVRPYVLLGLAKLWNQQIATRADGSVVQWTRNESAYPQGGVGLEIPVSTRLALAPEVRLAFLFLGGILRPNVTLMYRIH
jgi:hypothetical protein